MDTVLALWASKTVPFRETCETAGMRVGVSGAAGQMGRTVCAAVESDPDLELAVAVDRNGAGQSISGIEVSTELRAFADAGCEVVVDFTVADAARATLPWLAMHGIHAVVGTTGFTAEDLALFESTFGGDAKVPGSPNCLIAPNFAISAVLMMRFAEMAAPWFDTAEVIELHHNRKIDAPSGTAMAIGEAIADEIGRDLSECAVYGREGETGERDQQTIGFATVRAGDVVGEHTALFADIGERLEITHKASSRLTFAKGAVKAASWIIGKPAGLYDMEDVLGFK